MMNKSYNRYIVSCGDMQWEFNHINNAMDFVRAMTTAYGDITVSITKIAPGGGYDDQDE